MTTNQTAAIEWRDGIIPVSEQFDDPYFSIANGLAETRHVFLGGNDLPARFCDGFHIAELGFGTGLNMLAALMAWQGSGQIGQLRFTSFEAFPMAADDMEKSLAAFPEVAEHAPFLLDNWTAGRRQFETDGISVDVIVGDARQVLANWEGVADAWFLDGFSPAKNPEMWEEELMAEVARHTGKGGSFATYTAAGHVRRSLEHAGFDVKRVQGFGRKRHMSVGTLKDVK